MVCAQGLFHGAAILYDSGSMGDQGVCFLVRGGFDRIIVLGLLFGSALIMVLPGLVAVLC